MAILYLAKKYRNHLKIPRMRDCLQTGQPKKENIEKKFIRELTLFIPGRN